MSPNEDEVIVPKGAVPRPAAQRVLARIKLVDTGFGTPCWMFQGAHTSNGYGNVGSREDGHYVYEGAHRAVFVAAYGPIPDDFNLDHLCTERACVNPAHLEPTTPYENLRRQHIRNFGPSGSWLEAGQPHVLRHAGADAVPARDAMRASMAASPMRRGQH